MSICVQWNFDEQLSFRSCRVWVFSELSTVRRISNNWNVLKNEPNIKSSSFSMDLFVKCFRDIFASLCFVYAHPRSLELIVRFFEPFKLKRQLTNFQRKKIELISESEFIRLSVHWNRTVLISWEECERETASTIWHLSSLRTFDRWLVRSRSFNDIISDVYVLTKQKSSHVIPDSIRKQTKLWCCLLSLFIRTRWPTCVSVCI